MVQFLKIQWSELAASFLKDCAGEGWTVEDMRQGVTLGGLQLFGVTYFDRIVAVMLIRDEFPEMVVVGAGGITINHSTYKEVLPYLVQYAKENGYKTLRAHALDDARSRLLKLAGWITNETIYKIEVA
jgi:hypothetical protein